jgi:hypothetical protein
MGVVGGGDFRKTTIGVVAPNARAMNASTRYQSPSLKQRTITEPGPASSNAVVIA